VWYLDFGNIVLKFPFISSPGIIEMGTVGRGTGERVDEKFPDFGSLFF